MRRLLATVTVATALLGAAALTGPSAGAQPLTCTFTVSATVLATGGPVDVSGTAPPSTQVSVFLDGVLAATTTSAPVTGAWGPVPVTVTATSAISVSIAPTYGTTPCIGIAGEQVEVVRVAGATASLPRTGSDTGQTVAAAAALVGVGLVLLVGARRRRAAQQRA